ncbi:MAG TPA: GntR family transcriptional regulator [Actinomycetota bacterium]|nr:GntR family transcriptional regulator [Actinomycetota bacterium]
MARRPETLERDTTAKAVAERLRDEIQDGTLEPGTRLRQNEIARRFGVSTTPVREAFAQLQAEGMVRIDPHRGAVVFRPTPEDLLEFYEIREVLESFAVGRAIPRLTPEVERTLGGLIERMRKTVDARKWLRLNDDFHLKLYECAEMPRLAALIENLRDASTPYIHMFVAGRPPSERADDEHQAILDACARGDAEEAQRAIRQHLSSAAQNLVRALGGSPEAEAEAEAMAGDGSGAAR